MDEIFIDEETGECLAHPFLDREIEHFPDPVNNAETGEPEINIMTGSPRCRRVPFQIPKSEKEKKVKKGKSHMELEPVPSGASFGQTNPICLFLPAIIYFRWFLVVMMLSEVILHVWAHHKNKSLKDAGVYFRSPFHSISSEFCALCQNETCMNRVGKMQEIRMHKFLRQCHYMKRVVT